MLRALLCVLLGASLVATSAQQPKEKAKAPPRIAIDDPDKLKDDADFKEQGEYVGELTTADGKAHKFGANVVALGEGKFALKMFSGGLPGDGWDGKTITTGELARGAPGAATPRDPKQQLFGGIADGKLTLEDTKGTKGTLTKTERKSSTLGAKPPEGAVVLWGGPDDAAKWDRARVAELSDGKFLSVRDRAGDLRSKQAFGSFKAHVEFRLAWMPNSLGQGRSNSGVYFQDRYECQVLDSFGLKGENNECGGIYTQHKPSVNMCLPPMQWQTYDIEFTAAKYDGLLALSAVLGGAAYEPSFKSPTYPAPKKTANARLTMLHNGVRVHDNVEFPKECPGGKAEGAAAGPFRLQDHGDPVVYRNFWVVETK